MLLLVVDTYMHITYVLLYPQELEADKTMHEEKVKSINDHANKMIDSGHFESAKIMQTVKSFCNRYSEVIHTSVVTPLVGLMN